MVLESVVASVLNKVLGSYVENLDASQMNLGIWSGNVILNNLNLKATALDELDLPVKLKTGFLEKLTLKIPWKNLYTEAVVAEIQGLYVLAVPNVGIKYNAEKEERMLMDAKRAELARIEAAKQKPAEPQNTQPDTFAEKMTAQVIKNLQVIIQDIHIRYEDQFSSRERPFAAGITLHELCFQTTDETWKPCVVKELTKLIYKIAEMKSLSVYWNFNCKLFSDLVEAEEVKAALKGGISRNNILPPDFRYILSPISIGAYLKLNQKPETDGTNFKTPKIHLSVTVNELQLNVEKLQYQGVLEFLEAQEQFTLNAKYRKYRPYMLPYKGNTRKWWHFAITCILETHVRRIANNWSWPHIKEHRELMKKYQEAWLEKRTIKNLPAERLLVVELAEKRLDVFNLTIARQQAEIQIKRRGLKLVEEQGGWISWLSGWVSSGGDQTKPSGGTVNDITSQFEKAMTKEEKEKLYQAIDYQDNQTPTQYPKEFVENVVEFELLGFRVCVHDNITATQKCEVLKLGLNCVKSKLEMRPSAAAIKFESKIGVFQVTGCQEGCALNTVPILSSGSPNRDQANFTQMTLEFETNPLDLSCDQKLTMFAEPLQITYHAPTVNRLVVVMRPPESVRLKQLTTAAMMKYEDIKSKSSAGLQHALKYRKRMKVDLEIQPASLRIPNYGEYSRADSLLILDFGNFSIKSVPSTGLSLTDNFTKKTEEEKLHELLEKAYDRLNVELKSVKICFVEKSDKGGFDLTTPTNILKPTGFQMALQTAIVDDVKLPKTRIRGTLPDLCFSLSDRYLLKLLNLLLSIPTPPPAPVAKSELRLEEETTKRSRVVLQKLSDIAIIEEEEKDADKSVAAKSGPTQGDIKINQQVQVEVQLVLNQMCLNVSKLDDLGSDYVRLSLSTLGFHLQMKPLDMAVKLFLGTVEVAHHKYAAYDGTYPVYIMRKGGDGQSEHLLSIQYIQADRQNPFFKTSFEAAEQNVTIIAEPLMINVHQEALMDVQNFLASLQAAMASGDKQVTQAEVQEPQSLIRSISTASLSSVRSARTSTSAKRGGRTASQLQDIWYIMRVTAKISGLYLSVGSSRGAISDISIDKLTAQMQQRKDQTRSTVSLKSVSIEFFEPTARYKKILNVKGEEMFRLECIQYTRPENALAADVKKFVDMCLVVRLAEMRFVFLNLWLNRILNWLTPFQEAAERTASLAGNAIHQSARNAVEVLQKQDVSRIKLDALIEAPVIILPASSKSERALVAHLGRLSIGNDFSVEQVGDLTVVLDRMGLKLEDVKLSRAYLSQDCWTLNDERELLKPITFMLNVVRNLSFDYVPRKPRMSVEAVLPAIEVHLTSEDYSVLMAILSENLAEVEEPQEQPQTEAKLVGKAGRPTDQPSGAVVPSRPESHYTEQSSVSRQEGAEHDEVMEMCFSFALKRISVVLCRTAVKCDLSSVSIGDAHTLAGLELSSIQAGAKMFTDGKMTANVSVASFTLDDLRSGSIGIRRLLDKKASSSGGHILMASYVKQEDSAQKVDAILDAFFLCLSADFLLELSSFVSGQSGSEQQVAASTHSTSTSSHQKAARTSPNVKPSDASSKRAPPTSSMTITAKVAGIEVVLVEDSRRPEDTEAMFLLCKAMVLLKTCGTTMSMDCVLENLELMTSYFERSKRESSGCDYILAPCTLSCTYNKADESEVGKVKVSGINIRVSPATIRLLSSALSEVMRNKADVVSESPKGSCRDESVDGTWPVSDEPFWFMKAENGQECTDTDLVEGTECYLDQQMTFEIEEISFSLEVDYARKKLPMIFMRSSVTGDVSNWAGAMSIYSVIRCEIWSFNDNHNAWEPVLEPYNEHGQRRPWEFKVLVQSNDKISNDEYDDGDVLKPARMTISVMSEIMLELTVTKTFLELSDKLSKAFNAAASPSDSSGAVHLTEKKFGSPYVFRNNTGVDVRVRSSVHFEPPEKYLNMAVPHAAAIPLHCKSQHVSVSAIGSYNSPMLILEFEIPDWNVIRQIDVSRTGQRATSLPFSDDCGDQYVLVADISTSLGSRVITLRSPIMFINALPYELEIYFKNSESLQCGLKLDPNYGEASPPVSYVCRRYAEFFVRPVDEKCDVAIKGLNWNLIRQSTIPILLECNYGGKRILYMQALVTVVKAMVENCNQIDRFVNVYNVRFEPAVSILNDLACPLKISCPNMSPVTLASGTSQSMFFVHPKVACIDLEVELGTVYTAQVDLSGQLPEFSIVTFVDSNPNASYQQQNFGLHRSTDIGMTVLMVYAPVWMVNKTGLSISYKEDLSNGLVFTHPVEEDCLKMISLSKKNFFAKKSLKVRVGDSCWSSAFPLDSVGSSGRVSCSEMDKNYELVVTPALSAFGLTKLCTITPFYQLKNLCSHDIEVRQADGPRQWILVKEKECVGFWPDQKQRMAAVVRIKGTKEESQMFLFTDTFETLSRIRSEHVGIYVACNVSDAGVTLSFEDYQKGMIPALVINHLSALDVRYRQAGSGNADEWKTLKAGYFTYYFWDDLLSEKKLLFSCGKGGKVTEVSLSVDEYGEIEVISNNLVYYVSFLDGRQRVLLFTEEVGICSNARQIYELERADSEILVSLHGVGVSLVNDMVGREVSYISLRSTGVIWEQKKKRFRAFPLADCRILEAAYSKYLTEKAASRGSGHARFMLHKMHIDFAEMKIIKPVDREIRRSFQSGFNLQLRRSTHDVQLHVKINSVQIDNQLPGCVFQTAFSPTPLPKSLAAESVPKPFIEFTFIVRNAEHSSIPYVQYCKLLVQEMALKADQGFLNALMAMFATAAGSQDESEEEKFQKDMAYVRQALAEYTGTTSVNEQKAFYNLLHLSPLKLHLSYSQGGCLAEDSQASSMLHSELLGLLLKGVGVTLTEIQDVVLMLAYFERCSSFLSKNQLISEATNHYIKQVIKQIYVLVLGLDVLGNPFGLIRDLKTGVEQLFYEPIHGAIEGPEEFAEGLALGVRSLFGHTVGGAAGAVSRITGTLGKGIAALTLDTDYQKRRQEMINTRPTDLARSGTGAIMGVVDGVTGVFLKPIEGAREDGARGFAKGLGKGLIGMVTRPVSGVVDFASSSLEAVKKATDVSEAVKRFRTPRYIGQDKVVRPYNQLEAEGGKILHDLDKGKFSTTDKYVVHENLTDSGDQIIVATDQRIIHVSKSCVSGTYDIEWIILYTMLENEPTVADKRLSLPCKSAKASGGVFSKKSSGGKVVLFRTPESASAFYGKLIEAYRASKCI